jgi:alkanesulfonate monooxygenase SsuD/methylene tetrahydromethanopterin reductase-like flavin-dependent oxidoreductase (luciferase family)
MGIGRCRNALDSGLVGYARPLSGALAAHIACHGAWSARANDRACFNKPYPAAPGALPARAMYGEPVSLIAVGSGGQSLDWIARNAIGWMTYHRDGKAQRGRYSMWRAAVDRASPSTFRAFAVAMHLDLSADPVGLQNGTAWTCRRTTSDER